MDHTNAQWRDIFGTAPLIQTIRPHMAGKIGLHYHFACLWLDGALPFATGAR
jgi:hypothetical protein